MSPDGREREREGERKRERERERERDDKAREREKEICNKDNSHACAGELLKNRSERGALACRTCIDRLQMKKG